MAKRIAKKPVVAKNKEKLYCRDCIYAYELYSINALGNLFMCHCVWNKAHKMINWDSCEKHKTHAQKLGKEIQTKSLYNIGDKTKLGYISLKDLKPDLTWTYNIKEKENSITEKTYSESVLKLILNETPQTAVMQT